MRSTELGLGTGAVMMGKIKNEHDGGFGFVFKQDFLQEKLRRRPLTLIEICCCSVAVQFGIQFVIFAFHVYSFSVEVHSIVIVSFTVALITLFLVNLHYR